MFVFLVNVVFLRIHAYDYKGKGPELKNSTSMWETSFRLLKRRVRYYGITRVESLRNLLVSASPPPRPIEKNTKKLVFMRLVFITRSFLMWVIFVECFAGIEKLTTNIHTSRTYVRIMRAVFFSPLF